MLDITNEVIQQVKSVDIVDTINSRVKLKKNGQNYTACCPFHSEKTPSFVVSPNKNIYTCFGGCGSGDVIEFIQQYHNMNFIEAIALLASENGILIEEKEQNYTPQQKKQIKEQREQKLNLYEILEKTNNWYQQQLHQNSNVISYLINDRKLTKNIIEQFKIGYAIEGYNNLQLLFNDYSTNELLLECGLVKVNDKHQKYDAFRGRVTFPLLDNVGKVIAYSSRALKDDQSPKYLNSPEYSLFKKSEELYGFYQARNNIRTLNYAILVEGNIDVIKMHQHGFINTVATQGTACTESHIQKLFKICDKILIMFDNDEAGIKASNKVIDIALPLITDVKNIGFIQLSSDNNTKSDPDSFLDSNGSKLMLDKIQSHITYSEKLISKIKAECGVILNTVESKTSFLISIKKYLEIISNKAPIYHAMIKDSIANELNINVSAVEAMLLGNTRNAYQSIKNNTYNNSKPYQTYSQARRGRKVPSIYINPQQIIEIMLIANPKLAREYKIKDDFNIENLTDQQLSLYKLIDYLTYNCDTFEDVSKNTLITIGNNLENSYNYVLNGSKITFEISSEQITKLINMVL